jgi:hypothetical protein
MNRLLPIGWLDALARRYRKGCASNKSWQSNAGVDRKLAVNESTLADFGNKERSADCYPNLIKIGVSH